MLFILKNHYQKGVIEHKIYYRIIVKNCVWFFFLLTVQFCLMVS